MKTVIAILFALALGWAIGAYISWETPEPVATAPISLPRGNLELASPSDWIKEEDITVYGDRVVIDLPNAKWAKFTNTNSMDPLFDETSHALEIVPTSPNQIRAGDIISYKSPLVSAPVIHRVIQIGNDGQWYALTKGDNNSEQDPRKVRFEQVQRVLVAIIY